MLEISIALPAAAKILTADMIGAVLPLVLTLLKHDQEIVRKKSVMLLHRFMQVRDGRGALRALCRRALWPAVLTATRLALAPLPRRSRPTPSRTCATRSAARSAIRSRR